MVCVRVGFPTAPRVRLNSGWATRRRQNATGWRPLGVTSLGHGKCVCLQSVVVARAYLLTPDTGQIVIHLRMSTGQMDDIHLQHICPRTIRRMKTTRAPNRNLNTRFIFPRPSEWHCKNNTITVCSENYTCNYRNSGLERSYSSLLNTSTPHTLCVWWFDDTWCQPWTVVDLPCPELRLKRSVRKANQWIDINRQGQTRKNLEIPNNHSSNPSPFHLLFQPFHYPFRWIGSRETILISSQHQYSSRSFVFPVIECVPCQLWQTNSVWKSGSRYRYAKPINKKTQLAKGKRKRTCNCPSGQENMHHRTILTFNKCTAHTISLFFHGLRLLPISMMTHAVGHPLHLTRLVTNTHQHPIEEGNSSCVLFCRIARWFSSDLSTFILDESQTPRDTNLNMASVRQDVVEDRVLTRPQQGENFDDEYGLDKLQDPLADLPHNTLFVVHWGDHGVWLSTHRDVRGVAEQGGVEVVLLLDGLHSDEIVLWKPDDESWNGGVQYDLYIQNTEFNQVHLTFNCTYSRTVICG